MTFHSGPRAGGDVTLAGRGPDLFRAAPTRRPLGLGRRDHQPLQHPRHPLEPGRVTVPAGTLAPTRTQSALSATGCTGRRRGFAPDSDTGHAPAPAAFPQLAAGNHGTLPCTRHAKEGTAPAGVGGPLPAVRGSSGGRPARMCRASPSRGLQHSSSHNGPRGRNLGAGTRVASPRNARTAHNRVALRAVRFAGRRAGKALRYGGGRSHPG